MMWGVGVRTLFLAIVLAGLTTLDIACSQETIINQPDVKSKEVDITTLLVSNSDVLPLWWLKTERSEEFSDSLQGYGRYFKMFARSPYYIGSFENKIFVYRSDKLAHDAFLELRNKYADVVSETKELGDEAFLVVTAYDPISARRFMSFRVANAVITMDALNTGLDLDSLAKIAERRIRVAMDNTGTVRSRPMPYPQYIGARQVDVEAEYRDGNGFLVKGKIPGILTTSMVGWANTTRHYWGIQIGTGSPRGDVFCLDDGLRGTLGKDFYVIIYLTKVVVSA